MIQQRTIVQARLRRRHLQRQPRRLPGRFLFDARTCFYGTAHGCLFASRWDVWGDLHAVFVAALRDSAHFRGDARGIDKVPVSSEVVDSPPFYLLTTMQQYIVDAFTDKPFSGNPAAVCVLPSWPDDAWMRAMAMENNLSETAFLVPDKDAYRLRWFTPETEVGLCGHATLASAFVVLNFLAKTAEKVEFLTGEGILTVRRVGQLYAMDFPRIPQREVPVTEAMCAAFGAAPVKALLGADLVCVFESEEAVRGLVPDQNLLRQLEGRGQHATAPGETADCASRSFFPKLGIAEDPVCGSAHCQIAPYWAGELHKDAVTALQASRRGGILYCKVQENGRVEISGKACLFAISEIAPAALPR